MEWTLYFVAVFVIALGYVLRDFISFILVVRRSRKALIGKFDTPPYHPIFGHAKQLPNLGEEGIAFLDSMVKKYPRAFVFLMGPIPVLHLQHPETIKKLTSTSQPKSLGFGGIYKSFQAWIRDGLPVASPEVAARKRKLLARAFNFDILKHYMKVFNSATEELMQKFQRESASTGMPIDVHEAAGLCVLDIILQCVFSLNCNVQEHGQNSEIVQIVTALGVSVFERAFSANPLLHFDPVYFCTAKGREMKRNIVRLGQIAEDILQERKKLYEHLDTFALEKMAAGKKLDFLDILLMARDGEGNGIPDNEILDEIQVFMAGGNDVSHSSVAWALYNFARHPDYQARARAEVDSVLNDGRDDDTITYADLNDLPYLTRCVKESIRLYSTVPIIGKEIAKPIEIDGKIIPAGTITVVNIHNLHHNPEVWKDPMTYDPDRFLPERMAEMDSHAYLPFSAGTRACIGQNVGLAEVRTVLARILRRFEFKLDPKQGSEFAKRELSTVTMPSEGIHVIFTERN